MVRKRSRTSRKYYESEDNDSDSDFELDDLPTGPTQKKYSLRQRKRPLFTEDFDYDDDGEEIEPPKPPSDDEDFEVENELAVDEAPDSEYIDRTTYINHYEPEADEIPEEGLIDFEDMIRADIVVNKNRIDYDNIIQKTEIKVQPIQQIEPVAALTKSKRGRKPKVRPAGEIDSSLLEPETEVKEQEYDDKDDRDYNPEDDLDDGLIDCAKMVQTELTEGKEENTESNNLIHKEGVKNGQSVVKLDENEDKNIPTKEVPHINGNISADQTVEVEKKLMEITTEETKEKSGEIDDDDVVVIVEEKKCEVIVLDD
ncbi:hypothetical protein NQ317_001528 [Molorchus minor]|uniref:Uncharacterized protein n=1 Tax=Molorchus minor TaxID=1323400 RepID=A0ABQ9J888_9CUCU|nr:hypothetical protein NQ317_001528 [Molorchus minor]